MFRAFVNFACLAAESNQAIALRLCRLSLGGGPAWDESSLMIAEKVRASEDAVARLLSGQSVDDVVTDYRTVVQANIRRLSA